MGEAETISEFSDRAREKTANALALAGFAPFAALAAWLLAAGPDHASWPDALLAIRVYAIAILSFLGGIRWGASLSQDGVRRDLIASVAPSLAGWATMFMPPVTALAVLAAAFAAQGAWDVLSAQNGSLPLWFGHMRRRMTFLVVAALLAALYAAG